MNPDNVFQLSCSLSGHFCSSLKRIILLIKIKMQMARRGGRKHLSGKNPGVEIFFFF